MGRGFNRKITTTYLNTIFSHKQVVSDMELALDYRWNILVARPEQTFAVFKCYIQDPYASYAKVNKITKLAPNIIANANQDLKIMKLMTNGNGIHPTELGQILSQYSFESAQAKTIMKNASLSAPMFKMAIDQFGNEKNVDRHQIFSFFMQTMPTLERGLILKAVRRFFEYAYDTILPKAKPEFRNRNYKRQVSLASFERGNELIENSRSSLWKEIQIEYNLSADDVISMIKVIPSVDARTKILQQLAHKYLNLKK